MFGARLATLRKAAGLSQSQLAAQLKISPSAVGMYEQGRREPSVEQLAQIAKIFSVSIDFLVTGQPVDGKEKQAMMHLLTQRVSITDERLENRSDRPFSRQELAVLFAALLMEP